MHTNARKHCKLQWAEFCDLNVEHHKPKNPEPWTLNRNKDAGCFLKERRKGRNLSLTWTLGKSSSPRVAGTGEIYGAVDVFQQYDWPVCRLNEQLPQIDVAAHLITQRQKMNHMLFFAMVSGPKRDAISSAPTSTGILNTRLVRDDQHIKIKPIPSSSSPSK